MPGAEKLEHIRLVTRGYEVSSRGYIPVSQHLKYVELIRWRTMTDSDRIPTHRFMRLGVVRAQAVELFEDIAFGVELEVSMWLSRVGKTSMDFSHDMVRVADGVRIGRSTATIVALDFERKPATIDPAARDYVVDRDCAPIVRMDGEIPSGAVTSPIHVRFSDQDMQMHVNHARYADFVEDARLTAAAAGGYGAGAWDGPVRRFTISYEEEAKVGDPLVARSWVREAPGKSLDFVLVKNGARAATRARVELS